MALLFPPQPRSFRGRRGLKIALRAAHVLCAGVLTGAHLLAVEPLARAPWTLGTVVSGLLILALDLFESGVFLVQVRGLVVIVKIALLVSLSAFGPYQAHVLAGLVLASVVFSHAPSKLRYFVLLGRGRLHGAETSG